MSIVLLAIFICHFFNYAYSQTTSGDNLLKYPLKSITTFCQKEPQKSISVTLLAYDKENHLIRQSFYEKHVETRQIQFQHNKFGLLTSKKYLSFRKNRPQNHKIVFKYNEKHLLIYKESVGGRGSSKTNEYSYNDNGQLIASYGYNLYKNWSYSYKYDSQNRLIEKYKDDELEVSYEYSHNLLFKETRYFRNNNIETIYEYDDRGLLIIKKEKGKVVEKNIYSDGRLIERWKYYFGIDPCYHRCCNQFIYKYEYY